MIRTSYIRAAGTDSKSLYTYRLLYRLKCFRRLACPFKADIPDSLFRLHGGSIGEIEALCKVWGIRSRNEFKSPCWAFIFAQFEAFTFIVNSFSQSHTFSQSRTFCLSRKFSQFRTFSQSRTFCQSRTFSQSVSLADVQSV